MINRFEGDHEFLSNFHENVIWFNGRPWRSVEHAYQSCKTADDNQKKQIQAANTPGQAKRLGQVVALRKDWDEVKIMIMKMLVSMKFLQSPVLRDKLLATGEEHLVEGNTWHDNFWGDCSCSKCRSKEGKNFLGAVLMMVRGRLQEMKL